MLRAEPAATHLQADHCEPAAPTGAVCRAVLRTGVFPQVSLVILVEVSIGNTTHKTAL